MVSVYLCIVADPMSQFVTVVHSSFGVIKTLYHITNQKLWQFGLWNTAISLAKLKQAPQSQDHNPIEHFSAMVEREIKILDMPPTNLEELCNAQAQISKEFFQNIFKFILRRSEAVLKTRGIQLCEKSVYIIK